MNRGSIGFCQWVRALLLQNLLAQLGSAFDTSPEKMDSSRYFWPLNECWRIVQAMRAKLPIALLGALAFLLLALRPSTTTDPTSEYAADSQLRFPEQYREWVFLSAGFDMSYSQRQMDHHIFDNVFVNPEAYQSFLNNGTWPDKTMLVLESRRAEGKGSINRAGNYQSSSIVGISVHVKDEKRFPGKWAFFAFGAGTTSKMIPQSADCYSCHNSNGAVDTTFVQFYPTLLPIAKSKGTLTPAYQRGNAP